MAKKAKPTVEELANDCVSNMGDIFWDRDQFDPNGNEFSDPFETAKGAVAEAIRNFATI